MARQGLDALVVAAPEELAHANLRYLTGFTGTSAYLVVDAQEATFLTDSRYVEQAQTEVRGCRIVQHGSPYLDVLAQAVRRTGGRIGFEAGKVPVRMLEEWRGHLPDQQFVAADGLVEGLRMRKDAAEAAIMRQTARLAGEALEDVLDDLSAGWTEKRLSQRLAQAMQERGLDGPGFATIVGSGVRGSLPHAHPTEKEIQAGELVTIDFGGALGGYLSDETVTVGVGDVQGELRDAYDLVLAAHAAGIAAARPGIHASEVDRASRAVIEASAFRDWCFSYGVGHGVGLEIHEQPFAPGPGSNQVDHILVPGMTLTVEPGIYVPGVGGIRIEDLLLITEDGHERITTIAKAYRAV